MKISASKGLNNVTDPLRLGMEWLTRADNVNISNSGAITKRGGFVQVRAGGFTGCYSTADSSRAYIATESSIQTMGGDAVCSLGSSAPLYWAEVNGHVYFNNGADSGIISPSHEVSAWRESPASDGAGFKDAAGNETSVLYGALPADTDVIQHWRGRMFAAQWLADEDQTVVWFSEPLGYRLFSLDRDFIVVPGRVLMMAPHEQALLIGTDRCVHAYDGVRITPVTDYGVVRGQHWVTDGERVMFWTERGLCSALPFENLTEGHVSFAPGAYAGGCLIQEGGQKRYLVSLQQGGMPFNQL